MSLIHPDKHYALKKVSSGFQAGPATGQQTSQSAQGFDGGVARGRQSSPGVAKGFNGTTATPVQQGQSPQAPSQPVAPFLTGQQMADYAQAQNQRDQSINDTNAQLSNLRVNTAYQQDQGTKQAAKQYDTANSQLAARGLFQSSIRSGDLADITSTAASRNQYLTDVLNTATLNAQTTINTISNNWTQYLQGINRMMVENAQAIFPAQ